MSARDVAIAAVALVLGCLGPTAAFVAGMQARAGLLLLWSARSSQQRCWEVRA